MNHMRMRVAASVWLMAWCMDACATTCTTVQAGEWGDSSTWDCGCQPEVCDTLIVQHAVSADDLVLGSLLFSVVSSGSLSVSGSAVFSASNVRVVVEGEIQAVELVFNTADSVIVSGSVDCARLFFNAGSLLNSGTITASEFCGFSWFPFPFNHAHHNSGYLSCGGLSSYAVLLNTGHLNSVYGNFTVLSNLGTAVFNDRLFVQSILGVGDAALVIADTLQVVQLMELYGAVQCGQFVNGWSTGSAQTWLYAGSELVCGNFLNQSNGFLYGPGSLCISGHSENHGVISAPINICDITLAADAPPPYVDVNTGGYLLPIYRCAAGTCATVGMNEPIYREALLLSPNPADDWVDIAVHPAASEVVLLDGLARTVVAKAGPFTGVVRLARNGLPDGCYMVLVTDDAGQVISRERLFFSRE